MFRGALARSNVLVYFSRLRFKQEREWPKSAHAEIACKRAESAAK
jgi:hypothetical protein